VDVSKVRIRAATRVGHRITTMALPEKLFRRLSIASLETRMVRTEIVRRALEEWLNHYKKGRRG
jgi:metal-responsive CopG/Arc/MetJ family transcriptional regulator